jgi:hypothetical protein
MYSRLQSDVSRLRKIVINSLYSHRDVFLRELISNSNDALEKLRITSLTDKLSDEQPLNITIKAIPNEEGKGGRLVITGMERFPNLAISRWIMTALRQTTGLGCLPKNYPTTWVPSRSQEHLISLIRQRRMRSQRATSSGILG